MSRPTTSAPSSLKLWLTEIFVDPIHAIRGDDPVRRLCRAVLDATSAP